MAGLATPKSHHGTARSNRLCFHHRLIWLAGATAATLGVIGPAAPRAEAFVVTALVPPHVLTVPATVRDLLPLARRVAADPGLTMFEKVARLRDAVRATDELESATCGVLAGGLHALARAVDLPVRTAQATANGLNGYDTHVTIEVWMPRWKRWGISDPTFGGYFTLGRSGRPLGAMDLRAAVRGGYDEGVYWHASGGPNARLPSDYPINPLDLFRYVGVTAWSGTRVEFVGDPEAIYTFGGLIGPVSALSGPRGLMLGEALTTWTREAYLAHLPWAPRLVRPAALRAGNLAVMVRVRGARAVRVNGYETARLGDVWVTPVFNAEELRIEGSYDSFDIHATRRFPADRELRP